MKKKINDIIINAQECNKDDDCTGWNHTEELMSLIYQEIIGEDETPESYEPKVLTEKEISLAHHAVQFHARNALRKEQREKLDA